MEANITKIAADGSLCTGGPPGHAAAALLRCGQRTTPCTDGENKSRKKLDRSDRGRYYGTFGLDILSRFVSKTFGCGAMPLSPPRSSRVLGGLISAVDLVDLVFNNFTMSRSIYYSF